MRTPEIQIPLIERPPLSPLPVLRERARVRANSVGDSTHSQRRPSPLPSPGLPGEGEGKSRHSGFTFIEVLFAVILLGIGFIMIAGIFPAAIQQTGAAADETAGQAVAQSALALIQEGVNSGMPMPKTGGPCLQMVQWLQPVTVNGTPVAQPQLAMVGSLSAISPDSSNLVWNWGTNTEDRRYSWVAFYSRGNIGNTWLPFANVIVLAMKNSNFPYYVCPPPVPANNTAPIQNMYGLITTPATPPSGQMSATDINAELYYDSSGVPAIAFSWAVPNAATGSYVIIQADGASPTASAIPPAAGRIYRLGAPETTTSPNTGPAFQLQPGTDFQPTMELPTPSVPLGGNNIFVYVVGRTPTLGNSGYNTDFSGQFTGANQDIAIATGIVRIPAGQ